MDLKNMEIRCGLVAPSEHNSEVLTNPENKLIPEFENHTHLDSFDKTDFAINSENNSLMIQNNSLEKTSIPTEFTDLKANKHNSQNETPPKLSNKSEQLTLQDLHESLRESSKSPMKRSIAKTENHFIDVGSLTFGAIFGLGEKIEHRVIMARTTVQCLMIPRFWLFEKHQNPGNIWQRRKFYLNTTIPSRQMLFKDFLNARQWQKFKRNLIQSYLNKNAKSNNPTRIEDVPIICRIIEARDD